MSTIAMNMSIIHGKIKDFLIKKSSIVNRNFDYQKETYYPQMKTGIIVVSPTQYIDLTLVKKKTELAND